MPRKHTVLTVVLLSAAASASASPDARKPPADSKITEAQARLRAELFTTERDKLRDQLPRFRALCDKDGYPLVGNVSNKGPMKGYQPSELCKILRTRETRA